MPYQFSGLNPKFVASSVGTFGQRQRVSSRFAGSASQQVSGFCDGIGLALRHKLAAETAVIQIEECEWDSADGLNLTLAELLFVASGRCP